MTPDRWQEIDNLIMKVVERPMAERAAFLDQVCSADKTLRLEVESLISFREKAQSFLEVPALEDAAHLFGMTQNDRMGKLVIGRYRIEGQLGARRNGRRLSLLRTQIWISRSPSSSCRPISKRTNWPGNV
jgi:hypothetical protein